MAAGAPLRGLLLAAAHTTSGDREGPGCLELLLAPPPPKAQVEGASLAIPHMAIAAVPILWARWKAVVTPLQQQQPPPARGLGRSGD